MKNYLTRTNVKAVADLAVAFTVQKVVKDVINNNTSPQNFVEETQITVGSVIVGYTMATICSKYVAALVDTTFNAFEKNTYKI